MVGLAMSFEKYIRMDTAACLVVAALAAWAIAKHPYSYYTLVRWLAFLTGGYMAWGLYQSGQRPFALLFAGIAVLFNPLAPFWLARDTWVILDLVCTAVFLFGAYLTPRLRVI